MEKSWLINSIKNYNKDKKRVKEVIAFVKNNNGLLYAEEKMKVFQQEALQLLQKFPDSERAVTGASRTLHESPDSLATSLHARDVYDHGAADRRDQEPV